MTHRHRARLVGGPFDGDQGIILEPIPVLYVFPCDPRFGCGPSCAAGGVHWVPPGTRLPPVVRAERYDLDEGSPGEDGFLLYVYPDPSARVSELAAERALAAA